MSPYELDTFDGAYQDLPSVDDLEVAAAAAAAAMEAVDMTCSPSDSDEEVHSLSACSIGNMIQMHRDQQFTTSWQP